MFKWACLAVATAFLAFVAWVLNDIRVEVKRTSERLHTTADQFDKTGEKINEDLPAILEKTRKATDALGDDLPQIVVKTRNVADTLSEAAADIKKLKAAIARLKTERDPELVAYADSVLDFVGKTSAVIGTKPIVSLVGGGLQNPVPARAWAASARNDAILATILNRSKLGVLTSLTSNTLNMPWIMEFPGRQRVLMLDWLKANHPETQALFAKEP
jgi:hypothetical protein